MLESNESRAQRLQSLRELICLAQSARDLLRDSAVGDVTTETYYRMQELLRESLRVSA